MLARYAELLATHGLNVQPGQVVYIDAEVCHREFAVQVAEAAYRRGARYVGLELAPPELALLRIEASADEDLKYVPAYIGKKYADCVADHAAVLKIIGSEAPDILAQCDPKRVNTLRLHRHLAVKTFYDDGIGKSLVHWTVAAAATPQWGQKVFPGESPERAESRLWAEIWRITRADQPDCLELWKRHNERLQRRAQRLTEMKIKTLHFRGPDTDLTIGLSPCAVFKGGSESGPRGVDFEPNIPTEEVFTTPDFRQTEGHVRTTRPFLINGKLIKDLQLTFRGGRIDSFTATEGVDTFREYIDSDEGARQLGEVALVGIDSPIFQSGLVFEEILFDENAACHIAVGSAYKFCIQDGESMDSEQAAAIGCNESTVHTDMMISSAEVDVTAETYAGRTVELLTRGEWVDL